jgi:hypothetical protein
VNNSLPWTHEELRALRDKLDVSIETTERERPNIRPLPPMEEQEAQDLLLDLAETAITRCLTRDEVFMIGQLLRCFGMAVQAKTLKKPGRYFVISEEQIADYMKRQ